jgi:hypothetical protein
MNNKVFLAGTFRAISLPAAATIFPAMLIEAVAGGVQPHSTAGGFAEKMVAVEDALQGGTIQGYWGLGQPAGNGPTGYTVAGLLGFGPDMVQINIMQSGNLVNMILLAGYNYTVGLKLISDGAGHLKPTTGSPSQIIATIPFGYGVNLSASGAVNTINPVRFL